MRKPTVRLTAISYALATVCLAGAARAADFYAVDMNFARLKVISSAGTNTDVGPLNILPTDIDLAYLNGHLYAIDSIVNSGVTLYEINTSTGQATPLGTLLEDAAIVRGAESLTVQGNSLWVGYSLNGSGTSSKLAPLSLTGHINSASALTTNIDLDSAAWSGSTWRAVDVNSPSPGNSTLYSATGPTFTSIATASNASLAMNDLDYAGAGLWGMRTVDQKLIRLDPDTGAVLQTVTFPTGNGIFTNLATIPSSVPEPAILSAVAFASLTLRRRRQGKE